MRHWQPMCILAMQKLRDVSSAVTLPPFAFSSRVSRTHTQYCNKGVWKRLPDLIRGYQTEGEAQKVTATLLPPWWIWYPVMTAVLFVARKVILATTSPVCSATAVMVLDISCRTAQRKLPHQECLITMIDCVPTHVMITTAEADHTFSITDTVKKTFWQVRITTLIPMQQKLQ